MSESTLSLDRTKLMSRIGTWLGYGGGPTVDEPEWETQQERVIRECVEDGLRTFYYTSQYNWSFLRPLATLTLASGATTIALPDDYDSGEGLVTVSSSPASVRPPMQLTGEGRVRQAYVDSPDQTGFPILIAERPIKGTTALKGQRFELFVFPIADQAYTLQMSYTVSADMVTTATPYPLGGAAHSGTVLASCLACAEQFRDNTRGPMFAKYQDSLQASMWMDQRRKPANLGINADRSDNVGYDPVWNRYNNRVLYNGQPMES